MLRESVYDRRMKSYMGMICLLVLLCCSCSAVRTLDSESGLYDVKLTRNIKAQVDGGWTWGGGNPYAKLKKAFIYISPMDISKVEKDQPKMAPLMVQQMFDFMVHEVDSALREVNAANGTDWKLTDDPKQATVRVDTALVHFRPQRPFLRLLSSVGGYFVKVPGVSDVVGRFSKGDICLEMTIRDAQTGKLFMACKDSNSRNASLISSEAYKRSGNADVNLEHWAKRLAHLIRISAYDKLGNRTLQEYLDEMSWGQVLKARYIED